MFTPIVMISGMSLKDSSLADFPKQTKRYSFGLS